MAYTTQKHTKRQMDIDLNFFLANSLDWVLSSVENFSGASGRTCAALCTAACSWHYYAVCTCRDIHPTYYIYYLFYAATFKQQLATTITLPTLPTPTTRNTAALLRWKFQTSFSHAMYFYKCQHT